MSRAKHTDSEPTGIAAFVSGARLAPYLAAAGERAEDVEALYLWSERLAFALFADVGRVEVVMRSAMARELGRVLGPEWYARMDVFDDIGAHALARARQLKGVQESRTATDPMMVEEWIVASLMLGFWVRLLGRGTYAGRGPNRVRRIYDTTLWQPALANAFPGQARRDVERAARIVQAARNRIAHHEHIVWGVAPPGRRGRLSVSEVHATVLELAAFVDPYASAWIEQHSDVARVLATCPITDVSRLRL